MANEKNKNTELVTDEDPTAELEAVTFRQDHPAREYLPPESDENTHDVSEIKSRDARTISKLQYDIEQLRARWLGLETEIRAREELTDKLNIELSEVRDTLARKEKLLKSRDQKVKALKAEIRERDERHRAATAALREEVEKARKSVREIPPPPDKVDAKHGAPVDKDRLARIEEYADLLRRKMQDILALQENLEKERNRLDAAVTETNERNRRLAQELATVTDEKRELDTQLASIRQAHEEEIRILRFELGEAQDTVAQTEELNSQLASDLVDTRGFKEELERMLCDTDEKSRQRIDELEAEVERMTRASRDLEEKLDARSNAINVLLAELARKSEQMESIGEIGDVISDIDVRIAEQFDEPEAGPLQTHRSHDRVTRVLVGKVGDQLLRFPLFKDRLTIGRSDDNDIQLNATYISRRHAVVQTDGDTTRIIDWGSKNGVFVNSARITEHFLQNGDIVSIGSAHFRYDERAKRDV
jgi:chromosome segregation ATPase